MALQWHVAVLQPLVGAAMMNSRYVVRDGVRFVDPGY